MKKTEAILREMVMITLRGELTKIQRTNLETCITIHMHQKESTGMLCLGTCLMGLVPHQPVQHLCCMTFVSVLTLRSRQTLCCSCHSSCDFGG